MSGRRKKVPTFSLVEVAKHNTQNDLWVVINNKVYDVTAFVEKHPGGHEVLIERAGKYNINNLENIKSIFNNSFK